MIKKYSAIIGALFAMGSIRAQIVNIESQRIHTDSTGWAGSAETSFHMYKNNYVLYDVNATVHLQYKTPKSLYLLLTNLDFISVDYPSMEDQPFENAGFAHIRYNYKIRDRFVWEAFVQAQYNKPMGLDYRFLAGTGPRFKIAGKDKFRLYVAADYMFEKEQNPGIENPFNNQRMSSYISFTFAPSKSFTLVHTTYYQPLITDFSDYKISSNTSLKIFLTDAFYFKAEYDILFDTMPPAGVDGTIYTLNNGIGLQF